MDKPENTGGTASASATPWGHNATTNIMPAVDNASPRVFTIRQFLRRKLPFFVGGGIQRRLLMWGLGLFGFSLLAVLFAAYSYTVSVIRNDAAALQSELASVTGEQIHSFVRRKIDRFSDNANALSLYPMGSVEQRLLLGLLVKNDSSFTHASIIDSQGMEVIKVSDRKVYFQSDLTDQSQSVKFLKAVKGEDYVSPVYTSERAQPYITLAIPLWGTAQSIVGVVTAEADLSFLWEALGKIRFGTAGYAYLVNEHGKLIAHKDTGLVLKQLNLQEIDGVKKFLRDPTRADAAPALEGTGLTGKPVLTTYSPVRELSWGVILEEPLEAALAKVELLKRSVLALLVASLIVGAAIIAWVSRKITRPIQELRQDVVTIGAGNFDHRADIRTGDEIEELAAEFNKMTDALQNSYATLEQKVEQRTKEISGLYSVTTVVNESLALEDILNSVIAKIADIFHFESTRVYILNDELKELELRASFEGELKNSTVRRTFKLGQGIVGVVAESAAPMIFEDTRTDPRYAVLSATKAKYSAKQSFFAVFPIKTQSQVFGAILFNARSPRKLTSDESRLLTSMIEHIAVAVAKANLFRDSETRARQLSVLNTIGKAVSQSLDLDMVLSAAINKLSEALNFDASWIYILDSSGKEFDLRAYVGLDAESARNAAQRELATDVGGRVLESGEPMVLKDLQNETARHYLRSHEDSHALPFGSAAGFPIKAKEKVIGVLYVANKKQRQFAADELQLIESIAQEVGVAADNARLFEQVNLKTEQLGKMNQDLDEANRAKTEFIAAMSHELRTPLNVIMGNAELTGNGFWGEINSDQKRSMTQIHHHSQFLLKLVNNVLALSQLDAKKLSLELAPAKIDDLVANVQGHVDQLNRAKKLEVSWQVDTSLPEIVTDETKLEEILQNLIGNAFKFTPSGRIDVRVRNIAELNRVEFCVADTGIGIETQDIDRIFGAFEQIREAHTGDFNGVGLGLNIVKKYLDLMGGEIRVESRLGEGSKFTFSIPHSLSPPSHSADATLCSTGAAEAPRPRAV